MIRYAPLAFALAAALAGGCRPDPGTPVYPDRTATTDDTGGSADVLPGDAPFEEGDERLSFSAFYEGGYSEIVQINDDDNRIDVFEGSFSIVETDDRVEGVIANDFIVARDSWWAGAIAWDNGVDLSDWDTLHVALVSEDEAMDNFELGMKGGDVETKLLPANYGFVADGDWHVVNIPLADFTGVDLSNVTLGLIFSSGAGTTGESITLDDLYLVKEDDG